MQRLPKIRQSRPHASQRRDSSDDEDVDDLATMADFAPNDRQVNMAKYCLAHTNISLATVGQAFPRGSDTLHKLSDERSGSALSVNEAEAEVTELISRRLLPNHRLDVADCKLVSIEQGAWEKIREGAMSAAREIEHEMLLGLHRVNIVLAGLEVKKGLLSGGW